MTKCVIFLLGKHKFREAKEFLLHHPARLGENPQLRTQLCRTHGHRRLEEMVVCLGGAGGLHLLEMAPWWGLAYRAMKGDSPSSSRTISVAHAQLGFQKILQRDEFRRGKADWSPGWGPASRGSEAGTVQTEVGRG
jgi:hypothetical protein